MNKEIIKNWRIQWLSGIAMVADRPSQKRHWFVCDAPEGIAWQFTEMCCGYFDDLFLCEGLEYLLAEGYISKEEVQAVTKFHGMYDKYSSPNGDCYDHKAIFEDPKWKELNQVAIETCAVLFPLLTDSKEKKEIQKIIEQRQSLD